MAAIKASLARLYSPVKILIDLTSFIIAGLPQPPAAPAPTGRMIFINGYLEAL